MTTLSVPPSLADLLPAQAQPRDGRSGAVTDALQAVRAEDLVAELQDLLAVPSVTGSAAESEAQHGMQRRLRALGMDTDLWQIDVEATAASPDFPGMEAPRDEAWGLVGAWGGDDGPSLVLNGHVDVVPPGRDGTGRVGAGRRARPGHPDARAPDRPDLRDPLSRVRSARGRAGR